MRGWRGLRAGVVACLALAGAAAAAPVRFTYTSNAISFPIYDEPWELAWAEELGYLSASRLDGRYAEITIEADCEITGGDWACGSISEWSGFNLTLSSYGFNAPEDVRLVSLKGFTDTTLWIPNFQVDGSGQVVSWDFIGTEGVGGGIGDFYLSSGGDSFEWGYGAEGWVFFYCTYTYGYTDYGMSVCPYDGTAPAPPITSIDLGTGIWTVDATALFPAPLPAGLPLMLGGLAGLAMMRRRRGTDQT
jgi:hypothetical protein